MNFQNGSFVLLWILCCHLHWVSLQVISPQFQYVGLPAVSQTQGEVWPKPQQQITDKSYWVLHPTSFPLTYVGKDCVLVAEAIQRYQTIILRPSRGEQRLNTNRNVQQDNLKLQDENSFGILKSTVVYLDGPCENWPHLDMDEKYILHVNESGMTLTSSSVWGILRGLETFSQLLYENHSHTLILQFTYILDYPRFKHRGVLLDTARHYIPKRVLLQNLDAMSYNKFNVFHWHIVDDQSFPYQSKTFPSLSEKGAYNSKTHIYTIDDVAEIIEYARKRGIRVIPEFGTPAHTFSWGYGAPDIVTTCYNKNGEPISNWHGPLNPVNLRTYNFLKALFLEVTTEFPDEYFHLGGDETTFGCWKSNPQIQDFMTKNNYNGDYKRLLNYYFTWLFNALKTTILSKQYIVWQDVFDDGVQLSPDTVIQIWKEKSQRSVVNVTERGYRVILSSDWYISFVHGRSDWHKFYKVEPAAFLRTEQQRELVLGGEACLWGEFVHGANLIPRLWPRASAVAERLWSNQFVNNPTDAISRLEEHTCRMLKRGINAEPQNGPGYCEADIFL